MSGNTIKVCPACGSSFRRAVSLRIRLAEGEEARGALESHPAWACKNCGTLRMTTNTEEGSEWERVWKKP